MRDCLSCMLIYSLCWFISFNLSSVPTVPQPLELSACPPLPLCGILSSVHLKKFRFCITWVFLKMLYGQVGQFSRFNPHSCCAETHTDSVHIHSFIHSDKHLLIQSLSLILTFRLKALENVLTCWKAAIDQAKCAGRGMCVRACVCAAAVCVCVRARARRRH